MARAVTLFTGQWADLSLDQLVAKAHASGLDCVALAWWSDHFEAGRVLSEPYDVRKKQPLLACHRLRCWAISTHLVDQALWNPIDGRHRGTLPPQIWGVGDPDGVRRRAAESIKDTALVAAASDITQVNGFEGSSIWHMLYSFSPNDFDEIERGYHDCAQRWNPMMDVFDVEGVSFGPEAQPAEIASASVTPRRALEATGRREGFGINFDPGHFNHQFLDSAALVEEFSDRIYHMHIKASRRPLDGRRSILRSHLNFGEDERGWDFVSSRHRDIDFEFVLWAINRIGYDGPLSVEWQDSATEREWHLQDPVDFVRRADFERSPFAFVTAMKSGA